MLAALALATAAATGCIPLGVAFWRSMTLALGLLLSALLGVASVAYVVVNATLAVALHHPSSFIAVGMGTLGAALAAAAFRLSLKVRAG